MRLQISGLVSRKVLSAQWTETLMAIRVAHVGTGNVGGLALAELITNPQFELTGVCVSTPEKVGKDAGALCGVGLQAGVVTGVTAVADLDALLATKPECVVYCAMGDTR